MKRLSKNKKTIFKKDIEKKAAVLAIVTIFIISAINPAINRQYEESEKIEILDSGWNTFLDQNDIPGDQPLDPGESWWNTDWLYRKSITINYGEVDANLTNFPMLINLDYDDDLADDSKCQNDGDDIVFTNITGTELNHEIEYFDSDTGKLVCWVNVTKLSSTEDTVLYMYYGNPSCSNQENQTGVWDSNYVMVQHMDDVTTSTISDSTSYSNDGAKRAADEPLEVVGKVGMGQNFDGSNDYVIVSDADSLDPTEEITIEAWVYIDSYPEIYPRMISKDTAGNLQYQFITHNTDQIFFRIQDGTWRGGDFDSGALSTGSWIYIVGTYDGSTLRAFSDGVAQTTTYAHTGSIDSGTGDLAIGAKVDALGTYLYDGMLDEIRISNIARGSSWINTSFMNQNDPSAFYTVGVEESGLDAPFVSNVYPSDGAVNIPIQPLCQVDANDRNGDTLNVEWFENTTGGWVLRQTNSSVVANSTVYWTFSEASASETRYWWSVNVSESVGGNWSNVTFSFTTVSAIPVLSSPSPGDGASGVVLSPVLSILVNDSQGDSLDVYFRTNASTDVWHTIGENLSVFNSTVSCDNTSEMDQYSTVYWWSVNCSDGFYWTNQTFSFTTVLESGAWWDVSWAYRKLITIDYSQVDGDLVNFPVLISITDSDVKNNSQSDGDDIVFTDYFGSKLHHEIEQYDDGTGELVCWVNVTDLSSTEDTLLYMYYGNPGCSNQENPTGVWDSNYMGVWHLNETGSGSGGTHYDSTLNDNDGTTSGGVTTDVVGIIDGADRFDGSNDRVAVPHASSLDIVGEVTASLWVRPESLPFATPYPGMISRGNVLNRQYYIWGVQGASDIGGRIGDTNAAPGGAGVTLQENNWYHIVITGDPLGDIFMYFNGTQVSSVSYGNPATTETTSLYMGYMDTMGYLNGSIDEVRVSNVARNNSWINTSFVNQHDPNTFYTVGVEESGLDAPFVSNVYPSDGAVDIPLQPMCHVDANDSNGDTLTVEWFENTTGGWVLRQTNSSVVANSTVYWTFSEASASETRYWWSVNVSESVGGNWSNVTFSFTTVSAIPVLSSPSPGDGASGVVLSPVLSILVNDSQGDSLDVYFRTNASTDVWHTIGENLSVFNSTVSCDNTSEMDQYSTVYWWSVNCSDGFYWTNQTFSFTTVLESGAWWDDSWGYRKLITIDHSQVDGDLVNFPVLINITDSDVGNSSQPDGDDIVFTDYFGTKLNHEIELFDDGVLVCWVNVTDLNSTEDTFLYMYYGNPGCSNQENPVGVWDSGFLMVHHMVDATSSSVEDSTSNNHDGVKRAAGEPLYSSSGLVDGAQDFDGSDDIVNISHDSSLNLESTDFTVSVWLRHDTSSGAQRFVSKRDLAVVEGWHLERQSDGLLRCLAWQGAGNSVSLVGGSVSDGVWHFVVFKRDGDSWYSVLDDVVVGSTVDSDSIVSSTEPVLFGAVKQGSGESGYYNGLLDEIRVSDVARSVDWLSTEYNNQLNPSSFYSLGAEEVTDRPVVSDVYPADGAVDIPLQPTCSVVANDANGDTLTVEWFENTTGGWVLRQTNSSVVANSTVSWVFSQASDYSSVYWWSVNVSDGGSWSNVTFSFSTLSPSAFDPFSYGWQYRKALTVNHSLVAEDLVGFPVLISIPSDVDLAANAQSSGGDILFMNSSGVSEKLPHEIELFDNDTGELVCWVNVSELSSSVDTVLYMYYGNPGCSNQENSVGVWDSDFVMVQHMEDDTSSTILDSTNYSNDGTKYAANEPLESGGIFGLGQVFDNVDDYINCGNNNSLGPSEVTVEGWVNLSSYDASMDCLVQVGSSDNYCYELVIYSSQLRFYMRDSGGPWFASTSLPSLSDWHYWTGTYDGSTVSVYLDGVKGSDGSHVGINTDVTYLYIGRGFGNYIDAVIDEVRVSSVARSGGWVNTSFLNQVDPVGFVSVGLEESVLDEPQISNPSPSNGTIHVALSPVLSVQVVDPQGDSMDVYFRTNASTGVWHTIGENLSVFNNTFYCDNTSEINEYATEYWWSVNATDSGSGNWTNRTYSFTTAPAEPVLSNPSPFDGAIDVGVDPVLSITVNDYQGDLMNITFRSNASGVWGDIGTNVSQPSGTYSQASSNMDSYSTTYYWSVNCTDGTYWVNETYSFTTAPYLLGEISITYPVQYVVCQRHNDTTGEVFVSGTYTESPTAIEASFDDGSWVVVDDSPSGGTFSGSFNASVGQGNLTVRFSNAHGTTDNVTDVGVGDVFVIGGQSNAVGQGSTLNTLNSSNPFLATVYRKNDIWRASYDPTDTTGSGSPWVRVADYITQNQNVPVAYITTAVSGATVLHWQKGTTYYDNMLNQVSEATDGTMRVRAMLYYQGEKDARLDSYGVYGDYDAYKENLSNTASSFMDDTEIATTIVVGQIDHQPNGATRTSIDNIRLAQSDLWDENENISAGPVTHDIELTTDNLHFRTDDEIQIFADRWWASVNRVIYGVGDGRGPVLDEVVMVDDDTLVVRFVDSSLPVIVEDYLGTVSSEPEGWRVVDGATVLDDTDIVSSVVSDFEVELNLSSSVSSDAVVFFGSYTDGYGKPIVRDSSTYVLPAVPFSSGILLVVEEPVISSPSPSDGSNNVDLSPMLSVQVDDPQGDSMNVYFRTNASTGVWHTIGENISILNSTVYCDNTSEMGDYGSNYWWSVNATDSGSANWTNVTFSFTTGMITIFNPFSNGWLYRKEITIDHLLVDADLINFPVLINFPNDTDLAGHTQLDGDDILFMDGTGVADKLNHEIEYYDGSTGELVCWINITSVSSSVNTTFYMYYGNPNCANQGNPTGVWDSHYAGVWHLDEICPGVGGTHYDSTSNNNDGTTSGGVTTDVVGIIDGADQLDGSDDHVAVPHDTSLDITGEVTASLWIRPESLPFSTPYPGMISRGSETNRQYWIWGIQEASDIGGRIGDTNAAPGGAGVTLQENTWYQIVIMGDPNSDIVMYYNGAEVSRVSYGTTPTSETTSLYMGFMDTFGYFPGSIDEVRVSNVARNSSWINTSFVNQHDPSAFYSVGIEESITDAPQISNPSPTNGAINVVLTPELSVQVNDPQGDSMNLYFRTNASTGIWHTIGENISIFNSTVYCDNTSEMGENSMTYWWSVNATDSGSGNWTNVTLSFITAPLAPVLSNPSPSDNSIDQPINPTLSITVIDYQGDTMDITFRSNASGIWNDIGTNSSQPNGTYSQITTNMDSYSTTYYWSVNCTDGTYWTNETLSFTTMAFTMGNIYISYPVQYVVYQRHNDTTGTLFVSGTYEDASPTAVEASFDGGNWEVVDDSPSGGTFSGSFNASVGQGDLTVRFSNAHGTTDTVTDIGVGDVFVIGGQSNAVGLGSTLNTLNSSNPYMATVYRKDDAWRLANDPTDTTGSGSVWVRVADYITQTQNVPVAYITTAVSGSSVLLLQKGTTNYDNMINQVSEATDGSMRVRAMLYYQGERDARSDNFPPQLRGDYEAYKENLSSTASSFMDDTEVATTIVVGQIDNQPNGNRTTIDNIRWAQSDLWDEDENISAGPVTHDIDMTIDNLHFRTDDEIQVFADRWWASIRNCIYGVGDGRGPILDSIFMLDDDTLIVKFSESSLPIIVEDYLGSSSSEPEGWRIVDGATVLDDTDIVSEVISDHEVRLNLSTSVSPDAIVYFGSYTDGYGEPIVRDSSTYVLPAQPFLSGISSIVEEPVITSPSPSDDAVDVALYPVLSVQVNDSQGDSMSVYFRTNASTGVWHTIGENISIFNSTVYCDNTSEMSDYGSSYWWSVNATDSGSGNWTNATYSFTTVTNESPVFSNEAPSDSSTHVPITISSLSVLIEDPEGDNFNWTIETSPHIGSNSGTDDNNGSKTCTVLFDLNYDTTYTWFVNATDSGSGQSTNTIYIFTTERESSDWGYFKKITIDHTLVDVDLTNFPILFHNTSSDFSSHAQPDGDDFVFMNEDNTTQYNHEIELYNSTTGELIAWVNITHLSSTTDTVMYLYYGNSTTGSQENIDGTFDDNYVGVYHFSNNVDDSSGNNFNGTDYGTSNVAGQIGYARDFDEVNSDYINLGNHDELKLNDDNQTIEMWVNPNDWSMTTAHQPILTSRQDKNNYFWYTMYRRNRLCLYVKETTDANSDFATDNHVVNDYWQYQIIQYNRSSESAATVSFSLNTIYQEAAQTTMDVTGKTYTPNADVYIGRYSTAFYLNASLDEFRISNILRDDSWHKATYYTTSSPDTFLTVGSEQTLLPPSVYTVYVDDDFNPSTPGWNTTHFDNIQDGIDAVVENGTVNVFNGEYYENVVVNKTVDLIGEDKDVTIIDGGGSGDVVNVSADWVNITEFTIKNSGSSGDAGIYIHSNYSIITGNNISNNNYGIYLTDSSDNTIYNNYFNNTNNAYDAGSNTWNISKTLGTNIIGGPYLGGNYWSDYTGNDIDGDGLGDIYLPYNSSGNIQYGGDWLPLTEIGWDTTSPVITNVADAPDPQIVGGYVNVSCEVIDNVGVDEVKVNITYPDSSYHNETMLGGSYYYNVTYDQVGTYDYFIWANDTFGNSNTSATYSFVIEDTTSPQITNVEDAPDPQIIGGYVNVSCEVIDNVGVDEVKVNITYPDSSYHNETMLGGSYYYNITYDQMGTYDYFIWANDTSANVNTSAIYGFYIGYPSIVYVDDDYTASTPGWQIDHFDTIQDGIDGVAENGIVHAYNGEYYEDVVVNKTVDLIGEDKEATIIDSGGSGDVVNVSADWVNITGFTIKNSGSTGDAGIDIHSNYSIITGNNISNNDYGIYLTDSSDNTIYNNCFNNTNNAYDDGSNTWNISKTLGTNIIGGSYLGGNYWSDYTGNDADGDGLGDTPYDIPPGGSNQDLYPLIYLATTLRLVPENTTVLGYTNVTYELLLEYLEDGLSGYNITISLSNSSVASIVSVSFPPWAVLYKNSGLPSDTLWIKAVDLNNEINGDVANVLLANITVKALNAGTTFINLSITRLDDDNGQQITVQMQNSTLTVLYVLPPLPGNQNSPTDPDGDGVFEDLNGNGLIDFDDVVQFFQYFEWIETNYPAEIIDVNGNGYIDFDDIITLFKEV